MTKEKAAPSKVTAVNFVGADELNNKMIVERVAAWIDAVSPRDLAVNAAKASFAHAQQTGRYNPVTFRYTGGMGRIVKAMNAAVDAAQDTVDRARSAGDQNIKVYEDRLSSTKAEARKSLRRSIRIPVALWKKVEHAAEVLCTTPSDIIRIAVDELFLDSGVELGFSSDLSGVPTMAYKM
jgi:erythromycin esterase-like protein